MFLSTSNFAVIVAVLAVCQPQVIYSQLLPLDVGPFTGSISESRTSAQGNGLDLGILGLSGGSVNSESVTNTNGGLKYGGSTTTSNSKSATGGLNVLGLEIADTVTSSNSNTNGRLSGGVSNDLNIAGINVGTSLSTDNLKNGLLGLKLSGDEGIKLNVGPLGIGLLGKRRREQAAALALARPQGGANADSYSRFSQFGPQGYANGEFQANTRGNGLVGSASANVNTYGYQGNNLVYPVYPYYPNYGYVASPYFNGVQYIPVNQYPSY